MLVRSAGAGLENIDDELVVELPVDHFRGRLLDERPAFFVEYPEFVIDLAQADLINPIAAMNRRPKRRSEIGKFSTARAVWAP